MAQAIRKALYSSFEYFSSFRRSFGRAEGASSAGDDLRLGEYHVDYTMPSREEVQQADPETEDLFTNSKVISVKREP